LDGTYTTIMTLTLPPGHYVVTASVRVGGNGQCQVPEADGVGEFAVPSEYKSWTTTYSNTTAGDQDIHLQCRGVVGFFTGGGSGNLTAIQVASITSS
jgi:hypothetical protein